MQPGKAGRLDLFAPRQRIARRSKKNLKIVFHIRILLPDLNSGIDDHLRFIHHLSRHQHVNAEDAASFFGQPVSPL